MANDTTYCVYRIVCFQNGKCYVGQTTDFHRRKTQHLNDLKKKSHHSTRLQNAYNKYGMASFYSEVLEIGISPNEINQREIYWISHFDSYHHGYNQTPGGSQVNDALKKKCTWNDIEYESVTDTARACGIDVSTMINRLQRGYVCDNDVPARNRPVIWNGIEYPNVKTCSEAIGVQRSTLSARLRRGWTCDDDIVSMIAEKPVIYNGIQYPTVKAAAKANGAKSSIMSWRIRQGYLSDDAVPPKNKAFVLDGIEYESLREAARITGHKRETLKNWIEQGRGYYK